MKLLFLGSGSAFTVGHNNYQSNALLIDENSNNKLLIDCGTDARHSLNEQGFSYHDISDVFITHLHADHMGGLEWLGFTHKFDESCKRPNLYISEMLAEPLWETSLSGGMSSLEGEAAKLETYFNLHSVEKNDSFEWNNIIFHLIQTIHIMHCHTLSPCHGLFFDVNGKKIFYTADTQFAPHLHKKFYDDADIIFHDCETAPIPSGVHAHFDELCTLDENIKNKMWLYHYNPGPLPNAEKAGFKGFVKKGQAFEF